jgi:hypothetical protein
VEHGRLLSKSSVFESTVGKKKCPEKQYIVLQVSNPTGVSGNRGGVVQCSIMKS